MSFRSSLLPSEFPFRRPATVLLCVKNGWESQQSCKGAMIKFVPTINVSVIGRGEGEGAGEEGVIEQSTINGGKVTRHHNPLQL